MVITLTFGIFVKVQVTAFAGIRQLDRFGSRPAILWIQKKEKTAAEKWSLPWGQLFKGLFFSEKYIKVI